MPGLERRVGRESCTGPILIRASPSVVQAPGLGVQPRICRSIANAGRVQSISASATVSFGASDRPSGGCARASSSPDSMPSRVATSSPAPYSASRSSSVPAVSSGRIVSVYRPYVGPGVELLDEPERRRSGHLVAGHQRPLDRGRAAPGRQHREVQVDPAVLRVGPAVAAGSARRTPPPGSSRGRAR